MIIYLESLSPLLDIKFQEDISPAPNTVPGTF